MQNESSALNEEEMRAWRSLLRAQATLATHLDHDLATKHDLGLPDFEVLQRLSATSDGSLRMTELARSVSLSPSGLTRRLDGLVKQGYVERRPCPSDGRGLLAVLTERGKSKVDEMTPTHVQGVHHHFTNRLNEEQLRDLIKMLEPLATGSTRSITSPAPSPSNSTVDLSRSSATYEMQESHA